MIQRLDYSKPPPGYVVTSHYAASMGGEGEAIAGAWAHYKTRNDPPGMLVARATLQQGYVQQDVWALYLLDAVDHHDWYTKRPEARAAAWAWHDRRRLLATPDANGTAPLWPRCLTWSDEQVSKIERGLAVGADAGPSAWKCAR